MHHRISQEDQEKDGYNYAIGRYAKPIVEVTPGDTLEVETMDAFEGKVKDVSTRPSQVAEELNPLNGPVLVKGAEPGDALAVRIDSIVPRGPQPRGTTVLTPWFGGLSPTAKSVASPLPEIVRKLEITEAGIRWNKSLTLPYEPFIGTIGTAPRTAAADSLTPGCHGGNMDLPDVRPGAVIYLPVRTSGAYLHLGDCHAIQGDGELCGVAAEFPTVTTIGINVVKGWNLEWPLLENGECIMAIGSARPLEDAARIAYDALIGWMVEKLAFNRWDAYFLLTMVGKARLGNVVDPAYTVGAGIAKKYLVPSTDVTLTDLTPGKCA